MKKYDDVLKGGDLRSIGKANSVVSEVRNQHDFDNLFTTLFHSDRKVVMRTADAIEKITVSKPGYLQKHKSEILELCNSAQHVELKWHLALCVSRLKLNKTELETAWQLLTKWACDKNESKIVRVNSIQGLYNLLPTNTSLTENFKDIIVKTREENIPSINARIKKISKIGE